MPRNPQDILEQILDLWRTYRLIDAEDGLKPLDLYNFLERLQRQDDPRNPLWYLPEDDEETIRRLPLDQRSRLPKGAL